jgi:D-3-phosphoglycerate dehydrogenase / 2-oxoglutarate reductase
MAALYDDEMRRLLPGLELEVAKPDPKALVARLQGCVGVFNFSVRLTRSVIEQCPALRTIVFLGTGVDSWVDVAAAEERGIRVRKVTGYGDRTIAEHTLALIFAAVRRIGNMDRQIRAGTWRTDAMYELQGKTLGIIGLGGVGRTLAQLATSLDLKVIGWNRSQVPADVHCRIMALDDVLAQADIVSLHLALNDQTRCIIDQRRLRLMKPGAVFVNTARGALVDESALTERLESGALAGAGLDVFAEEPLARTHPLTRLDNVVLTAHSAWMSPDAGRRLFRLGLNIMREEMAALATD